MPKREIEVFRTIKNLSQKLRQPKNDHDIAVLLANKKEDLQELVRIDHLLEDLRLILILADREADTIAKAHTLRPRFLTYVDSDFLDVAAVLSKMLAYTHPNETGSKINH